MFMVDIIVNLERENQESLMCVFVGDEEGGVGEGLEGGEFEVLLVATRGVVGSDEVAEDGHKGEKGDDHEAGNGERVAAETTPSHPVEGMTGEVGGRAFLEELHFSSFSSFTS